MNAAYIAIGALFVVLGAGSFAASRKAVEETKAKNAKLSGMLMMLAGVIFMATAVVAGS